MNIEELRDLILKHFINENGDVDISELDFSDFDGNVYIDNMKVKNNLFQTWHEVKGSLFQDSHKVDGNLWQSDQKVGGDLWQDSHTIDGDLIQGNQKVNGIIKNYHGFEEAI